MDREALDMVEVFAGYLPGFVPLLGAARECSINYIPFSCSALLL
jgi:hypothetical protein